MSKPSMSFPPYLFQTTSFSHWPLQPAMSLQPYTQASVNLSHICFPTGVTIKGDFHFSIHLKCTNIEHAYCKTSCSYSTGESAVRNIIIQGRQAAAAASDPEKTRIEKVCNELDKLLDDLAALRRQGKV
jgi:hypothetical protein